LRRRYRAVPNVPGRRKYCGCNGLRGTYSPKEWSARPCKTREPMHFGEAWQTGMSAPRLRSGNRPAKDRFAVFRSGEWPGSSFQRSSGSLSGVNTLARADAASRGARWLHWRMASGLLLGRDSSSGRPRLIVRKNWDRHRDADCFCESRRLDCSEPVPFFRSVSLAVTQEDTACGRRQTGHTGPLRLILYIISCNCQRQKWANFGVQVRGSGLSGWRGVSAH
jgi:hypothetical protein